VVSVALAVVGVLAGCTSGGGQNLHSALPTGTLPGTSASPTLTPSRTGPLTTGPNVAPGEKPPAIGPFERAHTSAGAIAIAAFYIKALDWSYATSDPYLLKIISAPSCVTCNKIIDGLTALQAEGGHVVGDRVRLDSAILQFFHGRIKADYIVKVETTQEPGAIAHPTATTDRNGRSEVTSYIYVSWIGGWKILGDFGP
jgi:hypothetical protein